MTRKILAIFLIICTISTFAGCSSNESPSQLDEIMINEICLPIDEINEDLLNEMGYNIDRAPALWVINDQIQILGVTASKSDSSITVYLNDSNDVVLCGVTVKDKNANQIKFINDVTINTQLSDIYNKLPSYESRHFEDEYGYRYDIFRNDQYMMVVLSQDNSNIGIFVYNIQKYKRAL